MRVGLQVRETLLLHRKISPQEAKAEVLRIFRKVGISEPERRYNCYPHELSGGLRQRVMIAMAMICRPKLVIADEPTTALDVTVEAQILQLMRALRDETSSGIVIISHNLGVIAQLCDYVYVMYAGRVVEQADTFDLFATPCTPIPQVSWLPSPRLHAAMVRWRSSPALFRIYCICQWGAAFLRAAPSAVRTAAMSCRS